jgi:hypothetical protein
MDEGSSARCDKLDSAAKVVHRNSLRYSYRNRIINHQQRQGERMTVVRNANLCKYLLSGLVILMATSTFAASNLYNFTLPNIDGKPMPLVDFKGKVILMVNVASQCGFYAPVLGS